MPKERDNPYEKKEKRTGLTTRQKAWLRRAWNEYYEDIHCVFPVITDSEAVYEECNNDVVEWHHIKPQGYCKRILHIDPDVPYNLAPVCPEHHRVGQKDRPLDREHQDCIHLDAAWALKNYKGKSKPTSFDKVFQQRKKLTDVEKKYWYDLWDQYLLETAEFVIDKYLHDHPEDEWPTRE